LTTERTDVKGTPAKTLTACFVARVYTSNLVSAEMETAGIEPASAIAYEWLLRA